VKKLERFIGGTNESTNENTSIRYAFTVHAFKSVRALHCTARLPIQPSSSTVIFWHEKGNNESLRGPTSRAGMTTTIWRPRVRIDVPDVGDAENTDTSERGVEQEGHEAEECPEAPRAVRARGEVPLEVQGVQRLVRTVVLALSVQGVRWVRNLRARSCALSVQGVRWGINLRARSCAL